MRETNKEMVEGDPAGDLGSPATSCGQPEVLQLRRSRKNPDHTEAILDTNRLYRMQLFVNLYN
jgi:hypothetical protein